MQLRRHKWVKSQHSFWNNFYNSCNVFQPSEKFKFKFTWHCISHTATRYMHVKKNVGHSRRDVFQDYHMSELRKPLKSQVKQEMPHLNWNEMSLECKPRASLLKLLGSNT